MLLWLLFLLFSASAQLASCPPKFLLPEILHDSVSLSVFTTANGTTAATYAYTFVGSVFSSAPTLLLSLSQFKVTQLSQLNYEVGGKVGKGSVELQLRSRGMGWALLQLQLLLTSRKDITADTHVLTLSASNSSITTAFAAPAFKNLLCLHYILGIAAGISSSYAVGVSGAQLTDGKYQITAHSNVPAIITVQTIYFSAIPDAFAYSYVEYSLTAPTASQKRIFAADFAPVVYSLLGYSQIKVGGAFEINGNYDILGSYLQVGGNAAVLELGVLFFAIGELPKNVCSPCNHYISVTGCLPQCPKDTYALSLPLGGKTCRPCLKELGQTVGKSGCLCTSGRKYVAGNCFPPLSAPADCDANSLPIGSACLSKTIALLDCTLPNQHRSIENVCLCDPGYEKIGEECLRLCGPNSHRSPSDSLCVCQPGYFLSPTGCESVCPASSLFKPERAECVCLPNFEMVAGKCQPCSSTQIYDVATGKCLAKIQKGATNSISVVCGVNEVVVNDGCECDGRSVRAVSKCVACPPATFKSVAVCLPCSNHCQNCSETHCQQCSAGFALTNNSCAEICGDGRKFTLPCDDGNLQNGDGCSSACQIEKGYDCSGGSETSADECRYLGGIGQLVSIRTTPYSPVYTTPGILIDFVITPAVRRSQNEIESMLSYSFSSRSSRPKQVVVRQDEKDLTSYRVFFNYQNALPNEVFTLKTDLNCSQHGSTSITLILDPLSNRVSSAMHFDQDEERDRLRY